MPTNVPNIRFKIILSALSSKFSWWHILLAGAKICSGSTNPAPEEDLPPEVCSLAGRLLWLTRRPQSLLLLKNMKTRCILKAPEYTGRLLVLLRLAYTSNIFFRCTTTNKGRREPALGYPRSEYDWAIEGGCELCSGQSSDGKKATVSTCMWLVAGRFFHHHTYSRGRNRCFYCHLKDP